MTAGALEAAAGGPETVGLEDLQSARELIRPVLRATPIIESYTLSELVGAEIYLKLENLQRTGSFKPRGAYVHLARRLQGGPLSGVVCASAGNHAQGVAFAARLLGLPATVVMPHNSPLTKIERCRGYGARIVLDGENLEDALARARQIQAEESLGFVHPFADPWVIAGQGSVGLELLEELPEVSTVVVPVGGGGLLSGILIAIKNLRPAVQVIGVQAESASAMTRSWQAGLPLPAERPSTIADGIKVAEVHPLPFSILQRYVDDMVTVPEGEIIHAIVVLMERSRVVVEGAGAAGVAALLAGRIRRPGPKTCVILSGGNIDTNLVAHAIERGLTTDGRYLCLRTRVQDRPGQLNRMLMVLTELKVNILEIRHHREGWDVPIGHVGIELLLETRNQEHSQEVADCLSAAGYPVTTVIPPAD
jgi:threonine dehydratase